MKVRRGFVSNSSSSSFVIVGSESKEKNIKRLYDLTEDAFYLGIISERELTLPNKKGSIAFGRWYETFSTLEDRLNWVAIQYITMLFEYGYRHKGVSTIHGLIYNVLKRAWSEGKHGKGLMIEFDYNFVLKDGEAYIDHQSQIQENKDYTYGVGEVFKDEETLYNFLFCEDSAIYMGSDEDDWTSEYAAGMELKRKKDKERA